MEIPVRGTIFLQGVFFSRMRTLEDRMIEENISQQEQMNEVDNLRNVTDVRATRFKNKKQWAEAYKDIPLKCWHCGLSFKGLPCFIPRQIRNTSDGKEYDAQGLFCGFACAFSFLNSRAEFIRNKSYVDRLSMLKMLYFQFFGKKITEFKEAPDVHDLIPYGGHVDVVDYRNSLRQINLAMFNETRS